MIELYLSYEMVIQVKNKKRWFIMPPEINSFRDRLNFTQYVIKVRETRECCYTFCTGSVANT